ncbi:uncharacterized protein LOC136079719 isoform X3 [Hydra vulgaris]|uniref:Uncharacterized protein LOC136079719 isoform X3 n=1 Tax=Hydra vulgaris TaxID=6087 RepID=A0ABM4BS88_HYDVU
MEYETSNRRDFKGLHGDPAIMSKLPAIMSLNFFSDINTGKTEYYNEFGWKEINKEDNHYTHLVTTEKNRKNKPHPQESFMIWKYIKSLPEDKQIINCNKKQHEAAKSTYQADYYLNRKKEKHQTVVFDENEKFFPEKINSAKWANYQTILNGPRSRYGCYHKNSIAANGIVPAATLCLPIMKTRYISSYADMFSKNIESIPSNVYPKLINSFTQMSIKDRKLLKYL